MRKSVKLKSKDAEALQEFLERLRQVLGINLIEVKLFGSKAPAKINGIPILMCWSQLKMEESRSKIKS